jgi:hypothetical protein
MTSGGEVADWRTGPKGRAPEKVPPVGVWGFRGFDSRTARGQNHAGVDVALHDF